MWNLINSNLPNSVGSCACLSYTADWQEQGKVEAGWHTQAFSKKCFDDLMPLSSPDSSSEC